MHVGLGRSSWSGVNFCLELLLSPHLRLRRRRRPAYYDMLRQPGWYKLDPLSTTIYPTPLLSGQKANRFSWLADMALSDLVISDESAVWIGIFSNIVTERTCSNV